MTLDLDQLSNRREQLLFAAIALVLTILFFRLLWAPQSRKIDVARSRAIALKAEKEALARFFETTPTLKKSDTLLRKKGTKLKILFGEVQEVYKDLVSLMTQLSDPFFLEGMRVTKMSFQPPAVDKGFSRTDFSIAIRGGFADLIQYLERLEQFPALFSLEQINLQSDPGQPQLLQGEIQGRFFQLNSPATLNQLSQVGGTP